MPNGNRKQNEMSKPLTDLLQSSQKKFGELLREVCEVGGITQGILSREAKRELNRLIESGEISPQETIGSMEQPTISKVMAGMQAPTYYQVYIWLQAIRAHFNSPRLAMICQELEISLPVFDPQWERALWHLANFLPPEELLHVYENHKDLKLIEIYQSLIDHKEVRWDKSYKSTAEEQIQTKLTRNRSNR